MSHHSNAYPEQYGPQTPDEQAQGSTAAEWEALHIELCALLTPLYADEGCPDLDTVNTIIKRHNDEVARR